MHSAISPLPKKDVDKLYLLIQALKRIDNKEGCHETTRILNNVEIYLDQWSTNKDVSEFSQQEEITSLQLFDLPDVAQKVLNVVTKAFNIYQDINSLTPDRRKELIALGYFLQGELSTKEELSYIKEVLRYYLAIIEKFRNPSSSQ